MNGAQDLGGMQGFGKVSAETSEPWFHSAWERRVLALTLAMGAGGKWNIDMSRAARESLPPAQYLASSYYEIWFEGLQKLVVAADLATTDEIASGRAQTPPAAGVRVLAVNAVAAALAKGSPSRREVTGKPRFKIGDNVATLEMNPATHTRLPRYCRAKSGVVIAWHGAHVFPDSNATGRGEQPQQLYGVRFDARELWGPDTTATSVCVDCWEPYLRSA